MRMTVKTKINDYLKRNKEALSTRSAKVGSYSFLLTVVVVCVLIAGNILAAALPSKWTQFDISAARLYSLTSDTKAVVTNLKKDVNIYWVTQAGKESEVIEKILDRYSDLSKHIKVEKKNPDVYPTFAKNYTEEEVQNNSIIVECGDKNRYIAYDTIYQTDYSNYYTTGSVSSSFDGEGAITSAINYVVSDELPKVYTLSGYEGEEYLQKVGAYINSKINEFDAIEEYRHLPLNMKATLIQLNIADDYFKAKDKAEKLARDIELKEKEIYDLKHELISNQVKTETAEERATQLEAENKELLLNKSRLEEALEDKLLNNNNNKDRNKKVK